jgi:hypothetical protein
MACIGYNALDMTLDAFLGSLEDWDRWPSVPSLRAFGCMVHLVNFQSGEVHGVNLSELQSLASVLDYEIYENFMTPGAEIDPTIDIRTDAGWVQLINEDDTQLQCDYERIVALMPTLFEVRTDNFKKSP